MNVAARMESHGVAGAVHVGATTAQLLRLFPIEFALKERGVIDVKGKG